MTPAFSENKLFCGHIGFPWRVLCVMFRYFPDFCALDTSECWNFQDVCASCAKIMLEFPEMFVFWALKDTWVSRMFVLGAPKKCWDFHDVCASGASKCWCRVFGFGAPKHTGFSRMSGFWASSTGFSNGFVLPGLVLERQPRGLHHVCATLQNQHSTSEPHNNGSDRTSSQPRARKATPRKLRFCEK